MLPWRAGAEQEGEEEEGHITLRVIHQAAVMVMLGDQLVVGMVVGSLDRFME